MEKQGILKSWPDILISCIQFNHTSVYRGDIKRSMITKVLLNSVMLESKLVHLDGCITYCIQFKHVPANMANLRQSMKPKSV